MFTVRFLAPFVILAVAPLSTARDPEDADVLAEAKPSADETIHLLYVRGSESTATRVLVDVNGKSAPLPAGPVELNPTKQDSWDSPGIAPELRLSPDGAWIFAGQKVCTGYSIGCLYQRTSGAAYKVTHNTRFDALAWRFFAKQEEVEVEELLSSDSPAHLIDLLALSDHYLALRLRGAVFEIPHDKEVPQRAKNAIDETGVYDWCCVYDLKKGKFFVTGTMEDHNANSWERWANGDNDSWIADSLTWMEAAEKRLTDRLEGTLLENFRKEQTAWKQELEPKRSDKDFSELDSLRTRAGELEIQLLELQAR